MDTENPPTSEVDEFFNLLKASEELLQGHTKVTMLAFMIRLMAIKSKFFFSNNYYNELLKLFGISFQILISYLKTCTIPKNLSMSPVWIMRRLMSIKIVVCFFGRNTRMKTRCLKCGKPMYVEVVNNDGETVTTEVAHKQIRYMPIAPRLKQMFLSKRTAVHMRWHKDGEKENKEVLVHPSDLDAWKASDNFDP
jgi:hypothetical protein